MKELSLTCGTVEIRHTHVVIFSLDEQLDSRSTLYELFDHTLISGNLKYFTVSSKR